ncbi:membrane fusion protein (multidrug efflux system) [Rhodoblastus sphagnicola]|uniref:HlyD family secretion protein n=1 Tax=Rhodoblastus sphagnicola TaxID=333368 RepID=UPI00181AC9CC|nr:HlyD family secretion protein [Rhodoblastus sphagnicola]MBB4200905.1 membrane fusion protein (multidrug efflux system) [Rhodoblastus sphagnicola]
MTAASPTENIAVSGEALSEAKARPRPSAKAAITTALAILALAAALNYGRYWWTAGRFIQATDDAYIGGDVTVIAPKVAGFISTVAIEDNQNVRAGDLLIRLDDRDFRAALDSAEALVAAQNAALANLDATRKLQEALVDQVAADIGAAEAEVARTRFDYDRYDRLSAAQFASKQRFQQADADHKKALAADRNARAALNAARRRIAVIETQKAQARAALDQALAQQKIAALNLSYTEIRAPIDGFVGNRAARAGAFAPVGAALISLVPASGLWVDANFKESQIARMRGGQRATIVADVAPGEILTGRVVSMAPATGAQFSVLPPENATGNFTKIVQRVPVRIRLDGDAALHGRLRPGLSVTAEVDQRGGDGSEEKQAAR